LREQRLYPIFELHNGFSANATGFLHCGINGEIGLFSDSKLFDLCCFCFVGRDYCSPFRLRYFTFDIIQWSQLILYWIMVPIIALTEERAD
jgi:hypothetical protein